MKNLTHYFQSPTRTSDSSVVLSEEDITSVTSNAQSTDHVNSQSSNGKKKLTNNLPNGFSNINDKNYIPSVKCSVNEVPLSETPKESATLKKRGRRKRKLKGDCSSITEDTNTPGSKQNGKCGPVIPEGEENAEKSPLTNVCGVSPNAFEVLMSTQQTYSSAQYTNKGKLELVNSENDENCEKKEKKQRRRDSLEKMAEKRANRDKSVNTSVDDARKSKKVSRKRRIVIAETDSEDEKSTFDIDKGSKTYKPLELQIIKKVKRSKLSNQTSEEIKLCEKIEVLDDCEKKSIFPNGSEEESVKVKDYVEEESKKPNVVCEVLEVGEISNLDVGRTGDSKKSLSCQKNPKDEVSEENNAGLDVCQKTGTCGETKKRGSLFSYFNKVPAEMKKRHSEKIEVTADVHFPLVFSMKTPKNVCARRKSKKKKTEECEDEICIIETEDLEDQGKKKVKNSSQVDQNKSEKDAQSNESNLRSLGFSSPQVKTPVTKRNKTTPSWTMRIRVANSSPEESVKSKVTPLKRRRLKLTFDKREKNTDQNIRVNHVVQEETQANVSMIAQSDNKEQSVNSAALKGNRRSKQKEKVLKQDKILEPTSETASASVETVTNKNDESSDCENIFKVRRKKTKEVKKAPEEQITAHERPREIEKSADEEKVDDDVTVLESCDVKDENEPVVVVKRTGMRLRDQKKPLEHKVVQQMLKRAKAAQNKLVDSKVVAAPLDKANSSSDPKKLAPVFLSKKNRRPDRAFLQAQKTFLNSGVPEAVKKMVDIIKLAEEQEHFIFPNISHIRQKEEGLSWNLPDVMQTFATNSETSSSLPSLDYNLESLMNLTVGSSGEIICNPERPPKIKVFRSYLHSIKAESPDFPVFRTFKFLRKQVQLFQEGSVVKAGGRKSRRRGSAVGKRGQAEAPRVEPPAVQWTLKYRPTSSSEIFGNSRSVQRLKKWLEMWIQVKENAKHVKICSDGDSSSNEFINDGSDDEGVRNMPKNTVMLVGPPGSGKTMTVYAIARELGYKVLEVNASSRRTGRRVLAELLEATQSHHVQGNDQQPPTSAGIKSFFAGKAPKKSEKAMEKKSKPNEEQQSNKLSLILVEDVDVVFEDQDDGFVSALSTLVGASKRPVVLVTSNKSCLHLARFLEKSIVLPFDPAPSKLMSVWLQVVCLLEGVRVQRATMEALLSYQRNDVRRSLLHLQFWVLSGGNNLALLPATTGPAETDILDDESCSSWISEEEKSLVNDVNHPVHPDCLSMVLGSSFLPTPINLGRLWWSLPLLLGSPVSVCRDVKTHTEDNLNFENKLETVEESEENDIGVSSSSVELKEESEITGEEADVKEKKWRSTCSDADLSAMQILAETLSTVDLLSCCIPHSTDSEPLSCSWEKEPVDSLSLSEDVSAHWVGVEASVQEMSGWLVEAGVRQCVTQLCPLKENSAPMTIQPSWEETSWRNEQHSANNELWNAVPSVFWPERRAMMTDYVPSLRNISRLEQGRSIVNTKRRFYHYLKGLGVHAKTTSLDILCNTFDLGIQS